MVIENLLKSLSFVSAAGAVVGKSFGLFYAVYKNMCIYRFEWM